MLYLLHFDAAHGHARHYLGSTENLPRRMMRHGKGFGARLTAVLADLGEHWTLAAVFVPRKGITSRKAERRAKLRKNSTKFCPICRGGNHRSPPGTIEQPTPTFNSRMYR